MAEAVIVDCLRTAIGKAPRGALRTVRPDDLAATVLRRLVEKYPRVSPDEVDDVILGSAFPEAESGMNMARNVAIMAGLPDLVPGMTVNRFCASGLQAISLAAERIQAGWAQVIYAGGAESMSMIPMGGHGFTPNPGLVDSRPEVYISMGLTAEEVRKKYGISREDQDAFALRSHHRALAAQNAGWFEDEIVPVKVTTVLAAAANGGVRRQTETVTFSRDEGPRADTSMEALAKLKPAFMAGGTVTAGNSSQTSDGGAVGLVMSAQRARELGLRPKARFLTYAVAGVPPEIMGIGPVVAIPKALKMAGLTLDRIDVIELNEAFAAQALAVIRLAGLDPEKVNVNGGAIALGHPLGCTGAKLTAHILRELERRTGRYGMVTMCIGGGQGAAAILERI